MRAPGTGHGRCRRGQPRALTAAAFALLSAATFVSPPAGSQAQAEPEVPATGRYIDLVFDEVEVTEDIPYREAVNVDGELQTLHLDLYEPAGDTTGHRPVVVLFHGGSFVFGNHKDDTWGAGPSIAGLFARRGYVVASIQYRLRPDMPPAPDSDPVQMDGAILDAHDDAMAAVAWLRDHAAELRLDPRAIVPNGPSAGGVVAWNLAWMGGSPTRPESSGVPAAISIAGAPLVRSLRTDEPLATPTPGDAPVLAFHGTADTIVSFDYAEVPCSQAAEAGVRCDLVAFEGIGHPGIDARFLDQVPVIEQRTIAFLAEVVLAPLGYFDEPAPPGAPQPGPTSVGPAVPDRPGRQEPRPRQAAPAEPIVAQPAYTA
jgi:acetyl esterase/lipase